MVSFPNCLSVHQRGILTQLLRDLGMLSMKRSMLASSPRVTVPDHEAGLRARSSVSPVLKALGFSLYSSRLPAVPPGTVQRRMILFQTACRAPRGMLTQLLAISGWLSMKRSMWPVPPRGHVAIVASLIFPPVKALLLIHEMRLGVPCTPRALAGCSARNCAMQDYAFQLAVFTSAGFLRSCSAISGWLPEASFGQFPARLRRDSPASLIRPPVQSAAP